MNMKFIWKKYVVTKKIIKKKSNEGGLTHGKACNCNIKTISMQLVTMLGQGARYTKLRYCFYSQVHLILLRELDIKNE